MHVSAWIIVPWLLGLLGMSSCGGGLFICTIDLGFLLKAAQRWSGMGMELGDTCLRSESKIPILSNGNSVYSFKDLQIMLLRCDSE